MSRDGLRIEAELLADRRKRQSGQVEPAGRSNLRCRDGMSPWVHSSTIQCCTNGGPMNPKDSCQFLHRSSRPVPIKDGLLDLTG